MGASRVRALSWIPIAWFALLAFVVALAFVDYGLAWDEYRFPHDWGWAYLSSTNYLIALSGDLLFAAAGLTVAWRARMTGRWIYLAICVAAICFSYVTPDWCDPNQWIGFPRSACGAT
jgi:hypothetical protein